MSGWGKVVRAGMKGETGGEPKSISRASERLVGDRIIRKANALRERGPLEILRRGEEFHAAIPESPPTLNFPVALCVVPTGGGVLGACGGKNSSEQSGQELGSSIGMDDIRCATGEPYCVEEGGNESGCGAVLEWEDKDGFRETVHDCQSFGLASDGLTLALEVHGVA